MYNLKFENRYTAFFTICFDTPRVPSSGNSYVNSSNASALAQCIQQGRTPVSTRTQLQPIKYRNVKNNRLTYFLSSFMLGNGVQNLHRRVSGRPEAKRTPYGSPIRALPIFGLRVGASGRPVTLRWNSEYSQSIVFNILWCDVVCLDTGVLYVFYTLDQSKALLVLIWWFPDQDGTSGVSKLVAKETVNRLCLRLSAWAFI